MQGECSVRDGNVHVSGQDERLMETDDAMKEINSGTFPKFQYICIEVFVKDEQAVDQAVGYIREHFPCTRPGDGCFRVGPYYVVFTLAGNLSKKQRQWLNAHAEKPVGNYSLMYGGGCLVNELCKRCRFPFDDPPSGLCLHCGYRDPHKTVVVEVTLRESEYDQLGELDDRFIVSPNEFVRRASLWMEELMGRGNNDFLYVQAQTAAYSEQQKLSEQEERQRFPVQYTKEEYQHLQEIAERLHLAVPALLHQVAISRKLQRVVINEAAAVGRLRNSLLHSLQNIEKLRDLQKRINKQRDHLAMQAGFSVVQQMQQATWDWFPRDELIPCTEHEIEVLESQLGMPIPGALKAFLLWMGQGAGTFLQSGGCFYPDMLTAREQAKRTLEQYGKLSTLPEDALVIYIHEGVQFSFIRTSEGDNPPVYSYGDHAPLYIFCIAYEYYSDFLETELAVHKEFLNA
jgi:hypothetical protein